MAKKMLTPLDMSGLEIRNFIVHNTTADNAKLETGSLIYDTNICQLRFVYGAGATTVTPTMTTLMDTAHYAAIPTENLTGNGFLKRTGTGWTIDTSTYATTGSLSTHASNTTLHVSPDERTKWNNTAADLASGYYTKVESDARFSKVPFVVEKVSGVLPAYLHDNSYSGNGTGTMVFNTDNKRLYIRIAGDGLSAPSYYGSWASDKESSSGISSQDIIVSGSRIHTDGMVYECVGGAWKRVDCEDLRTMLENDSTDYIDTWNEVVSFLDGYSDDTTLASTIAGKLSYGSVTLNGSALASGNLSFYAPATYPAVVTGENRAATSSYSSFVTAAARKRVVCATSSDGKVTPTWDVDKAVSLIAFKAGNTLTSVQVKNLTGSTDVIVRVYLADSVSASEWEEVMTDVRVSASYVTIGLASASSVAGKAMKVVILV